MNRTLKMREPKEIMIFAAVCSIVLNTCVKYVLY